MSEPKIEQLIMKELDFEFGETKLKFVYYGERHINNGCLGLFINGDADECFLFNPEQLEDLKDFLEKKQTSQTDLELVKCPFCDYKLTKERFEKLRTRDFQNRPHPIDSYQYETMLENERS